jgi:hypothetical protein
VFGIALGYEDLNDHDELRHDPMMAILAGKLTARREDCAPVAGKSTLNRLELSKLAPTRYHKMADEWFVRVVVCRARKRTHHLECGRNRGLQRRRQYRSAVA